MTAIKGHEKYHVWKIGILLFFFLNGEYPFSNCALNEVAETGEELEKISNNFSYCAHVRKTKKKLYHNCSY